MLFLSACWLIAMFAIILGYILVLSKSILIPTLYLFGKGRGLTGYGLHQDEHSFYLVPKRWFSHFYFCGIVCNSLVMLATIHTYLYSGTWPSAVRYIMDMLGHSESGQISPLSVLLAVTMIEVQVVRRFIECVYVSSYSRSTMSLVIYIVGLMFYAFIGISVLCQAPETKINLDTLPVQWFDTLAVAIFIWASYKQNRINKIFAKLRQDKSGHVEDHAHHIPHGDLFRLVSCPHYCMEIIIYTSMNILFFGQHEILLYAWAFVVCNQVISAIITHSWYKEHFPSYPPERKALIPHIF